MRLIDADLFIEHLKGAVEGEDPEMMYLAAKFCFIVEMEATFFKVDAEDKDVPTKEEHEEKLKPCPFCGHEAHLEGGHECEGLGKSFWYVACENCFTAAKGDEDKETAIANWNRRAK